jgi:hypothetical protein
VVAEASERIVEAEPLAIVGSIGAAGTIRGSAELSVLRCDSALGAIVASGAAAATVAAGAAAAVSAAGLVAASTAGAASGTGAGTASTAEAASGTGAVAAGSMEPAPSAAAPAVDSAAASGVTTMRGGSNPSGSTYPCGSLVKRAPKYTYGSVNSTAPLGPTVPTTDPSPTRAPRTTPIDPRWTSVAVYPNGVWIDTVLPPVGTVPAKDTTPSAGASTGLPLGAPRSTPRCWPPA